MATNKLQSSELLPFELYDISDFVVEQHPIYHPLYEQVEYKEYWTDQVKKSMQGQWGHDYSEKRRLGGYRFAPGNMLFYINHTDIKVQGEESREEFSRPRLRDIEWKVFYALTECDGFSGFLGDTEFSSYLPLGKLQGKIFNDENEKISKLTNLEKQNLKKYDHLLRKPNGEYKQYITPQEALYKTYDEPQGDPMFHNEMKNLILLSSRGTGKSFMIANGVIMYDFIFGSARTEEEFFAKLNPSVSVVGAYDARYSKALLSKFTVAYERLRKGPGSFEEEDINSVFYQPYDGSLAPTKNITNSIQQEGSKGYTGTGSEIWHVSYKDNPQAAVGYRARRMVIEEAGTLENFVQVHNENSGTQGRETKIGYTIYIGTGGNVTKIKQIREAFYSPYTNDCVSFKDTYSKKGKNIGLFIPAYYRKVAYKDKNGNTNIKEAFEDEIQDRENYKKTSIKRYEGHIVSFPIYPYEMFLQTGSNTFPVDLIESRLTDLETGEWEKIAKPGKLSYVNKDKKEVYFEPISLQEVKLISRWGDEKNFTDDEFKTAVVIYEHPIPNKPELSHTRYMYLVTYDSVKDEEGGTSLACVQVWKFFDFEDQTRVQFNLVAEWIGRHIGEEGLNKDHEVAFKLSTYYNAPLFPEINLKDILRYGRMTSRWYRFLPKQKLAIEGMEINQKAEYPVGLLITKNMKPDLEKFLNEALHTVVKRDHSIIGDAEMYKEIKMASEIPSMRLCEELIYYNREGNFDTVSSSFLFAVASRQREIEPIQQERENEERSSDEDFIQFLTKQDSLSEYNPAFNY